jgi:hypothetical protein
MAQAWYALPFQKAEDTSRGLSCIPMGMAPGEVDVRWLPPSPRDSIIPSWSRHLADGGRQWATPAQIMPAIKRGIEAVQEGKPALVDVSLAW